MHLVLIETSGNQNYIFSTNKLKENIGASELTYLAGTAWVLDAVANINGTPQLSLQHGDGSEELRKKLLDRQLNKPIEEFDNTHIEVIIATSGKALLLAREEKYAREVIQKVTHEALIKAPGLDICGAIQKFDWKKDQLGNVNRKIHQKFEEIRSKKPSLALRFLRLPVVDECSTSGLPAYTWEKDKEGKTFFKSFVSEKKQKCSKQALKRFEALLKKEKIDIDFLASIRSLNEELGWDKEQENKIQNILSRNSNNLKREWLAIVHADGNGLGEIFLNFGDVIGSRDSIDKENRNYVEKYRHFSMALDICTERAFLKALSTLSSISKSNKSQSQAKIFPLVPLVVGGDDLTVVCDGKQALQFTKVFLQEFENNTEHLENLPEELQHIQGVIPEIAQESLLKAPRLSACAGIAIIKPHFPFSTAYELAEDLIRSAKKVKDKIKKEGKTYPCSALDFHVLYDSSGVDLDTIREKLVLGSQKTKLYGRPYIVTPENKLSEVTDGKEWARQRYWTILEKRVQALKTTKDGKRKLPSSQMHDLREGLFLGKNSADARFKLIMNRYQPEIRVLTADCQSETLFWKEQEQEDKKIIYVTGFLDAMDAVDFFEGES